jgi:hypothetical protein
LKMGGLYAEMHELQLRDDGATVPRNFRNTVT